MVFKIGTTALANIPASSAADRGGFLISDGAGAAFWSYPGVVEGTPQVGQWRYRTIYTHGYLACGYKGSNPWRSVNKTWHATEVTMYCGEQISFAQGYTNGVWSDHNAYIVAGSGDISTPTAILCSYSLNNGTVRTFTSGTFQSGTAPYGYQGNDPKNEGILYGTLGSQGVGGMALSVAKIDPPATQDIQGQNGYISGGGDTSTQKLHFPSEVMYTTTAAPFIGRGDASYGETKGWFHFAGVDYANLTFSNDSWASGGWGGWNRDFQGKMMGAKHGHFYSDQGSNVTLPKAKVNQSSGATITTFNKIRAYGEANNQDGQDNGYVMGHFDGQQNNHTIRQSYSTDIEVTLGTAAQPKGHFGQSSGACSTGAATVTYSINT
jgi:hypothetical protein